jgi:glucose/arabinose dehydrogenase/mono/diheme cytochrome c family protein
MKLLLSSLVPLALLSCALEAAARTPWVNARLAGTPEPPPPYVAVRAYPQLAMKRPVALELEPGTGKLLLLQNYAWEEKRSTLRRFTARTNVSEAETLLELPEPAYSICLHPRYVENGWIYLGSNGTGANGKPHSRIVRYTMDRQPPHGLVEGSALTIIEWPSAGHNGAAVAFGNDGMLYVTSGDGTGLSDLDNVGQDLTSLCSKVLRLDVAHSSKTEPYRVPPDNPFVGRDGIRPETWAYGLRNPWRITADRQSGQIWVGQNGQDLREFAHLLERGANYGWSAYEGSRSFIEGRLRGPSPFTPPTVELDHSVFRSLTGGFVYRGEKFPSLVGAYIYGDYGTGRIWAARHDGQKLLWNRELADTPFAITGFGTNPEGDILVADHSGDALYRLEPAPAAAAGSQSFPERLSETGLFSSVRALLPAPGVEAYAINAPAWHDGAAAERWLALPGTSAAELNGTSNLTQRAWLTWTLPNGTALAQTLTLPATDGKPARRLETRVLLKQENDWSAYSYVWNETQDDAVLAPKDGTQIALADREWRVPSRSDCLACHSRAANFALGLTSAQLHRDVVVEGASRNQLSLFIERGLLRAEAPDADAPRLVDPYAAGAPLDERVRAYFATNCAHCHIPNGGGNSSMDLTPWVAPDKQHLIDAIPEHGNFGSSDARLISPANRAPSVLPTRMAMRGTPGQMPPLGTTLPDTAAIQMLSEWLQRLPSAPAKP